MTDWFDGKKKSKWLFEVVRPVREHIDKSERMLAELPDDVSPGAREIALLTACRRAQSYNIEPVIKALEKLREAPSEQWSGKFLVAEADGFNWKTAPWVRYESFEDFYCRELEPTWGEWKDLIGVWDQLVRGETTHDAAIERIKNNAATARERVQAAAIVTKAEDKMAQGRPAKKRQIAGYTQEDRAGENEVSERTQRKLDHLAAHRPDLMAQVQAGKIATSKAYDIARGVQKTPLTALQSAWRKADQDAKSTFLEWIEANP